MGGPSEPMTSYAGPLTRLGRRDMSGRSWSREDRYSRCFAAHTPQVETRTQPTCSAKPSGRRPVPRAGKVRAGTSHRRRQVLGFLSSHLSCRQIAARLYISPNTAKSHAKSLYRKLGVSSRDEAVAIAVSANAELTASPEASGQGRTSGQHRAPIAGGSVERGDSDPLKPRPGRSILKLDVSSRNAAVERAFWAFDRPPVSAARSHLNGMMTKLAGGHTLDNSRARPGVGAMNKRGGGSPGLPRGPSPPGDRGRIARRGQTVRKRY